MANDDTPAGFELTRTDRNAIYIVAAGIVVLTGFLVGLLF